MLVFNLSFTGDKLPEPFLHYWSPIRIFKSSAEANSKGTIQHHLSVLFVQHCWKLDHCLKKASRKLLISIYQFYALSESRNSRNSTWAILSISFCLSLGILSSAGVDLDGFDFHIAREAMMFSLCFRLTYSDLFAPWCWKPNLFI